MRERCYRSVTVKTTVPFLSYLFDNLPLGLVVLDRSGRVVVYNRMEEKLAGRSRAHVIGADFFTDIAPCMNVRELGGQFHENIGRRPLDTQVEMSFAFPHVDRPRDVKVRMCSLDFMDEPACFLMIEDVSLQRSVERMREQLQSLLVHDFKNPLAAVEMNLQLLEELQTVRDTPDALESINHALAATKRLGRMTLDLLDISRLETAQMPLRPTRVELFGLLSRVRNDNLTAARLRGARVHVAPGVGADMIAVLDEDLIVRALNNLTENAIRHASTVMLDATLAPTELTLRVLDDGPGVPEALRERMFEKYVQVTDGSQVARSTNRGLGLTFVKLVARAHGGDVDVTCPADGGSVFTLRIPRHPATP